MSVMICGLLILLYILYQFSNLKLRSCAFAVVSSNDLHLICNIYA